MVVSLTYDTRKHDDRDTEPWLMSYAAKGEWRLMAVEGHNLWCVKNRMMARRNRKNSKVSRQGVLQQWSC